MKPGIYTNAELSNEEYHGGEGVSSTILKELITRSAAHCKALMDGLRRKSSASMSLGTVIHSAVLEPETFNDEYFILPDRSDYPDALETIDDYKRAAEEYGLDLSAKTGKAEIRAALEAVSSDLVFWEDLVAAAPSKEKYPDALDSVGDYKEAAKRRGIELPSKAKKSDFREALEKANADVVFWDDLAAQIPKKADYPDALDSVADYRAAAERLGVDLSAKSTKPAIRAELERVGASVMFWEDLVAVPEGKTPISRADADAAAGVSRSVQTDPEASRWLSGGVAERSFVWVDRLTGELCKVRTDYYIESEGVLSDLKTCEDARPEAVARAIARYGYDVSAAMYLDGVAACGKPARKFVWVFAETVPPYAVRCYEASGALLDRARQKYRAGLDQFSFCHSMDSWPSYPSDLVEIDLPVWARVQEENDQAEAA